MNVIKAAGQIILMKQSVTLAEDPLCYEQKTVGKNCYARVEKSVDTSQFGCTESCLYNGPDGNVYCFKGGPLNVTESCAPEEDRFRHIWTCQHCKSTGTELGSLLTSEESLAEIGGTITALICPQAPDPVECQASLPGFWAGIAMTILPKYATENVCDLDTCPDGESEVQVDY